MYGGSHYIRSAAANMTAQGRSIFNAAIRFGDGRTLPFPPCKRYYNPYGVDEMGNRMKMYACRLHHELRKKRVMKEGWRDGEKRLDDFWVGDGNEKMGKAHGKRASSSKIMKQNDKIYEPDDTLSSRVAIESYSEKVDMSQPNGSKEVNISNISLKSNLANENTLENEGVDQPHDNLSFHASPKLEKQEQSHLDRT